MRELHQFYFTKHDVTGSLSQFMESEGLQLKDGVVWTSTLTCPVSGTRFPSGTLPEASIALDNKVYYQKKQQAMRAAASRAIDVLQYQELGIREPRRCTEDPALVPSPIEEDETPEDAIEDTTDSQLYDNAPETIEEPEQEWVVRHVPNRGGRGLPSVPEEQALVDHKTPPQALEDALSSAKSWTRRVAPKPQLHGVVLPSNNNAEVGKSILWALAQANQNYPSPHVEDVATDVLLAISDPADRDYANYLKCIHGTSPRDIAHKATSFYNLMLRRGQWRDRVLSRPGPYTTNAIIQAWAQVGVRYQAVDSSFVPNRDSFLAILSSCAYGGLDIDFASACLDRMAEVGVAADIGIYNAPLRWSGGTLFRQARPYAQYIPWDNYENMYRLGYVEGDGETTSEVALIEAWMERMENDGVEPNIETYEALIQALMRRRTQDCVKRAIDTVHDLLKEPENSPRSLRRQTLHPIFAALLQPRVSFGLNHAEELVDMLHERRLVSDQVLMHVVGRRLGTLKQAGPEAMIARTDRCCELLSSLESNRFGVEPYTLRVIARSKLVQWTTETREQALVHMHRLEAILDEFESKLKGVHREGSVREKQAALYPLSVGMEEATDHSPRFYTALLETMSQIVTQLAVSDREASEAIVKQYLGLCFRILGVCGELMFIAENSDPSGSTGRRLFERRDTGNECAACDDRFQLVSKTDILLDEKDWDAVSVEVVRFMSKATFSVEDYGDVFRLLRRLQELSRTHREKRDFVRYLERTVYHVALELRKSTTCGVVPSINIPEFFATATKAKHVAHNGRSRRSKPETRVATRRRQAGTKKRRSRSRS